MSNLRKNLFVGAALLSLCGVGGLMLAPSASIANEPDAPARPATQPAPGAGGEAGKGPGGRAPGSPGDRLQRASLRRTMMELRASKQYLENAGHDFGGHKAAAIASIDNAIRQLELAIQHDRNNPGDRPGERPGMNPDRPGGPGAPGGPGGPGGERPRRRPGGEAPPPPPAPPAPPAGR